MAKRIVILDAKAALRDLLRLALVTGKGHEVLAETDSGLAALELCRLHRPDLGGA